jgi:hypothetical protein
MAVYLHNESSLIDVAKVRKKDESTKLSVGNLKKLPCSGAFLLK